MWNLHADLIKAYEVHFKKVLCQIGTWLIVQVIKMLVMDCGIREHVLMTQVILSPAFFLLFYPKLSRCVCIYMTDTQGNVQFLHWHQCFKVGRKFWSLFERRGILFLFICVKLQVGFHETACVYILDSIRRMLLRNN